MTNEEKEIVKPRYFHDYSSFPRDYFIGYYNNLDIYASFEEYFLDGKPYNPGYYGSCIRYRDVDSLYTSNKGFDRLPSVLLCNVLDWSSDPRYPLYKTTLDLLEEQDLISYDIYSNDKHDIVDKHRSCLFLSNTRCDELLKSLPVKYYDVVINKKREWTEVNKFIAKDLKEVKSRVVYSCGLDNSLDSIGKIVESKMMYDDIFKLSGKIEQDLY